MNGEVPNTDHFDWRLQGVDLFMEESELEGRAKSQSLKPAIWGGFASYNDKLVEMSLPNPCAIYIALANESATRAAPMLGELEKSFLKTPYDEHILYVPEELIPKLFDTFQELIACVIFAYTSIEAFSNASIPDEFDFVRERADGRSTEIFSKEQIERYISLDTKLHEILPDIYSVKSPKGTEIWEDFIWLKKLRDRFVHLKSSDWVYSAPEDAENFVWSQLLNNRLKVLAAHSIAVNIVEYYCHSNKPRWLEKLTYRTQE